MNAQALRKFVEENQRLASECAHLVTQCNKWERECSLYDHDREALMDFGNEADQRAKEAEIRVQELEDEVKELRDELGFYKHKLEMYSVISSTVLVFVMLFAFDLLKENEFGPFLVNNHCFLDLYYDGFVRLASAFAYLWGMGFMV